MAAPRERRSAEELERDLETLYEVSRVLSRSLDMHDTLVELLDVLNDRSGLRAGMIALLDPDSGELFLAAMHEGPPQVETVRFRAGEGLVGSILAEGRPVVARRLVDEPRFLDRTGLYDPELPFVGVPIAIDEINPVGVLAAQPTRVEDLDARAHFLQMVANLTANGVGLARRVAHEQRVLREERDDLRRTVRGRHGFDNFVGHNRLMRTIFEQIRQVAKWNTTVLVRGESGTGKELVANAIHYNSQRASSPFVKLNCAALPDTLLESELFGHEKGAFTGATAQRKGRFEQADGGTIFLDEIGEISAPFQAKLLRVLQEGEFERVGGTRTLKVDVRVIAATNRDLEALVEQEVFREDLYYRLNVMIIRMPALRDRLEDIPDLARHLVGKIARNQSRKLDVTESALRLLMHHDWPGNVRELGNCLERAAVMSEGGVIDREVVALSGINFMAPRPVAAQPTGQAPIQAASAELPPEDEADERERVVMALEQAGWVQAKAARLLGMTPRQVAYRVRKLGITMRRL